MRDQPRSLLFAGLILAGLMGSTAVRAQAQSDGRRMVLVELFTSQGCDMCPTAEALLGQINEASDRIVPIAFHVDYFNKPWHDPFSEAIYSQRQFTYNTSYKKPKNAEYGIYYTPMLMIDGEQSVNGRDKPTALATIRAASAKRPQVGIVAKLALKEGKRSGDLTVRVTKKSPTVAGREVLIAAVLREDGVVTKVESGENAGKALTGRFAARRTQYGTKTLATGDEATVVTYPFAIEPTWNTARLRLAVFVQDAKSGYVYQAADIPWTSAPAAPAATSAAR